MLMIDESRAEPTPIHVSKPPTLAPYPHFCQRRCLFPPLPIHARRSPMKSSVLSVSSVFMLLVACGTVETTDPDGGEGSGADAVSDVVSDSGGGDATGDGGTCVDGAERMVECNTCTCVDGAWMCTRLACEDVGPDADEDASVDDAEGDARPDAACEDGAERMEDCNTCTCMDGGWACTEMACVDAGPDVDAAADADAETDTLDGCLNACGVGCPAPEFQPCGTDGERHCSECIMACEGVGLADTTFACEAPCELPSAGTEPEWAEWTPPEDCPLAFPEPFGTDAFFAEFTDEAAFELAGICPEGVASEIDWDTQRLVRAVVADNPSGSLLGVRQDADVTTVYLAAPVYCGGAPPPSTSFYVLLPAGDDSVEQNVCIRGACQGPPRP